MTSRLTVDCGWYRSPPGETRLSSSRVRSRIRCRQAGHVEGDVDENGLGESPRMACTLPSAIPDGKVVHWEIEAGNPNALLRRGLRATGLSRRG